MSDLPAPRLLRWTAPVACGDPGWEEAYARFETRAEEVRKFRQRLRGFGVEDWPRDLAVVELFCSRGSGLEAWRELGFQQLEGVDLSETLLRQAAAGPTLYVGDCRRLELADASRDVVCIQGGLHHLATLPEDVRAVMSEVRRVLRPGGRCLVVEPWLTPFLRLVHAACRRPTLRRGWPKLDALAAMIDCERTTYLNWLARPAEIEAVMTRGFHTERRRVAWGKLAWLGRKLPDADSPR